MLGSSLVRTVCFRLLCAIGTSSDESDSEDWEEDDACDDYAPKLFESKKAFKMPMKAQPKPSRKKSGGGAAQAGPVARLAPPPIGFYELVGLQQFDGRWAASSELQKAVGNAAYVKLAQLNVFKGLAKDFVATWCVRIRLGSWPCFIIKYKLYIGLLCMGYMDDKQPRPSGRTPLEALIFCLLKRYKRQIGSISEGYDGRLHGSMVHAYMAWFTDFKGFC